MDRGFRGVEELKEKDVLDLMEFRMGGAYLAEIKQLRHQHWDKDYIEKYYLQKDETIEEQTRKRKILLDKADKVKE